MEMLKQTRFLLIQSSQTVNMFLVIHKQEETEVHFMKYYPLCAPLHWGFSPFTSQPFGPQAITDSK